MKNLPKFGNCFRSLLSNKSINLTNKLIPSLASFSTMVREKVLVS
ncbi:MAG: hypothetical protein V1649_04110 [Patescibacteria group bacterium]